jgi:hypothetical protein
VQQDHRQDFSGAARRHYDDATLLASEDRLGNADHLAGYAAECALKQILIDYLGARRTATSPVSDGPDGQPMKHQHLPDLWGEVGTVVSGRSASSAFANLIGSNNPFSSWSIHDRYTDGGTASAEVVASRIAMARQIIGSLQNARAIGALQ